MDMNKLFSLKTADRKPRWHVIDASGKILGRLATEVATILRGKNKAFFTPHIDAGDYVVVINCDKIELTGEKWTDKMYERYSGYRSGLKKTSAQDLFAKKPDELVRLAVRGMLPKNRLNRTVIKKLKVYTGSEHPHKAQVASATVAA